MAVLLETSKGDVVVDLFVEDAPIACKNFLKLCKMKYYNNCVFFNVQQGFIVQSGDPENTGRGGSSVYGLLYGEQARFFEDEIKPTLRHRKRGMLGMASAGRDRNASSFYITTGVDLGSLDEKRTVFGEVAEGMDVLDDIEGVPVDDSGRPYQNIRIRHTHVLDDPYPDPNGLADLIPDGSPPPQFEQGDRLEEDWKPPTALDQAAEEQRARDEEARQRAVVLEMVGDLPDADAKPPSNMLFVCKLNPVTTEEDLEIIFGRFGKITSCDIIRDAKTGDSLNYGFIGFEDDASCEDAYFKMNNVLIDDRRIKVDFSQSVYHLWKQFRQFGNRNVASARRQAEQHDRGEGDDVATRARTRGRDMVFDDADLMRQHLQDGGNAPPARQTKSYSRDKRASHGTAPVPAPRDRVDPPRGDRAPSHPERSPTRHKGGAMRGSREYSSRGERLARDGERRERGEPREGGRGLAVRGRDGRHDVEEGRGGARRSEMDDDEARPRDVRRERERDSRDPDDNRGRGERQGRAWYEGQERSRGVEGGGGRVRLGRVRDDREARDGLPGTDGRKAQDERRKFNGTIEREKSPPLRGHKDERRGRDPSTQLRVDQDEPHAAASRSKRYNYPRRSDEAKQNERGSVQEYRISHQDRLSDCRYIDRDDSDVAYPVTERRGKYADRRGYPRDVGKAEKHKKRGREDVSGEDYLQQARGEAHEEARRKAKHKDRDYLATKSSHGRDD